MKLANISSNNLPYTFWASYKLNLYRLWQIFLLVPVESQAADEDGSEEGAVWIDGPHKHISLTQFDIPSILLAAKKHNPTA